MRNQWLRSLIPALAFAALPVLPTVSHAGIAVGVSINNAPPDFNTLKISRKSFGKSGQNKCVSIAVTKSNVPSANGNFETLAC